jgi:Cu-Zn family superoxide dismutase
MMTKTTLILALAALLTAGVAAAEETITIRISSINSQGAGEPLGTITVEESPFGTIFRPELEGMSTGLHGFHIHENPSCDPAEKNGQMVAGLAAGGHYDPGATGVHEGPYGNGHLGDLPALYFDPSGRASHPVLAPRVQIADLKGRAIIIHAGGDNYSDQPEPLGGGGPRVACGIAKP